MSSFGTYSTVIVSVKMSDCWLFRFLRYRGLLFGFSFAFVIFFRKVYLLPVSDIQFAIILSQVHHCRKFSFYLQGLLPCVLQFVV